MPHRLTLADLADRNYGGSPKQTNMPNPWEPPSRVPAVESMAELIAQLTDEVHEQRAIYMSSPDYYGIPRHRAK